MRKEGRRRKDRGRTRRRRRGRVKKKGDRVVKDKGRSRSNGFKFYNGAVNEVNSIGKLSRGGMREAGRQAGRVG